MSLKNTFARGFVWKVAALLAVALFSYLGIGKAHAVEYCGLPDLETATAAAGKNVTHTSKQAALNACNSTQSPLIANGGGGGWYARGVKISCVADDAAKQITLKIQQTTSFNTGDCSGAYATDGYFQSVVGWAWTEQACTPPQIIDPATETCFTPPTEEECLARNSEAKKPNTIMFAGATACVNNCSYGAIKLKTTTQPGNIRSGEMGFTGGVCNVPPPNPPPEPDKPPEEKCIPNGTLTMCVKPNGDHCYSASTGRFICWKPGETGEKTDGPIKQVNSPGETPNPPSPPKPGDTQNPAGQSGPTVINNNGNTSTSVVSNVSTGSGNNAGKGNQGQPAGNTGDGDGAKPDQDKDGNGSSGGGSCATPPENSGDPLLSQIATQTWLVRCGNDKNNDGQPDWTKVTGDGSEGAGTDPEKPHRTVGLGISMLDESGFFGGSRACPQLGVLTTEKFGSFDLDAQPWMCDFVTLVNVFFKLMGAFIAFGILAGRSDA